MEEIKLTQFSHGSGCGCKIAPKVLEQILQPFNTAIPRPSYPELLVGYDTKDDAAVYDMGNGKAIISTTDFFMPIVDNAFDFGRIASTNSISDVYAMGGKPLMAIAILGWPVDKIPTSIAQQVLDGARTVCNEANIPLAGGHSIDSPEPIFGLAVTGEVGVLNIKKNSTASPNCKLYLTKPVGVGIITTANKRGLALPEDFKHAVAVMAQLNAIGYELGKLNYVKAMTDITGFGLLGHLIEMCEGSNLSATINFAQIPLIHNLNHYISQFIYPDATFRNWKMCENKVEGISNDSLLSLCDPQTSGGLLVAVSGEHEAEWLKFMGSHQLNWNCIGELTERKTATVLIQ